MLLAFVLAAATSCSKKEQVSLSTLEDARKQAKENVVYVAQTFRAENQVLTEGLEIVARGDSTQDYDCPQGDGWASVDLINKETKKVQMKIKCSTFSLALGCMEESDFSKKRYAGEENHCSEKVDKVPKMKL